MNDYWLKKAKANQKDRDKIEKATLARLQTITNETSAAFHKALSDYKADFDVTDLGVNPNEKVTPKELATLRKKYSKLLSEAKTEQETLELARLASLQKATQAQVLANSINLALTQGTMGSISAVEKGLTGIVKTEAKNMAKDITQYAKLKVGFNQISPTQVQAIIHQGYNGTDFSSKLWYDRNRVAQIVRDKVPGYLAQGLSVDVASKELAELLQTNRTNAERILRTEGTYVASQADKLLYDQIGIDRYEFIATLDSRTSEICMDLDGKVFEVKDARPETNFPPMHPNCRSTTVPDVDTSDLIAYRSVRDTDGKSVLVDPEGRKFVPDEDGNLVEKGGDLPQYAQKLKPTKLEPQFTLNAKGYPTVKKPVKEMTAQEYKEYKAAYDAWKEASLAEKSAKATEKKWYIDKDGNLIEKDGDLPQYAKKLKVKEHVEKQYTLNANGYPTVKIPEADMTAAEYAEYKKAYDAWLAKINEMKAAAAAQAKKLEAEQLAAKKAQAAKKWYIDKDGKPHLNVSFQDLTDEEAEEAVAAMDAWKLKKLSSAAKEAVDGFANADKSGKYLATPDLTSALEHASSRTKSIDWNAITKTVRNQPISTTYAPYYQESQPWVQGLSSSSRRGIADYSGSLYKKINDYFFSGGKGPLEPATESAIKHIDAGLRGRKLQRDTHLWRGVKKNHFGDWQVGDVRHTETYWSTSLNYRTSASLMGGEMNEQGVMLRILAPKGSPGQYLDGASIFNNTEAEVLLPRNTPFRVLRKTEREIIIELIED